MRQLTRLTLAAAALGAASAGHAAVLFADNFDGYPTALTVTDLSPNWTVAGNVDVVDSGTYNITCSVKCVDLDGTTGPGTITSKSIAFLAGRAVTVSFDVSGNQRNDGVDNFIASVSFNPANGGSAAFISGPPSFNPGYLNMLNGVPYVESISGGRGFLTYSYTFTAVFTGTFKMSYGTDSADNIGPILDNVLVTQASVPEPAAWALLIAGFGMVGAAARRRQAVVAA